MDDKILLNLLQNNKLQLQKVMDCNEYTKKFGVSLTEQYAIILMEARKNSLKEQERIEFSEGILYTN